MAIEAMVLKEMARVWVETNMKLGTVILIMRRMPLTMVGVRLSLMPLAQNSQNFWNAKTPLECFQFFFTTGLVTILATQKKLYADQLCTADTPFPSNR